MRNNLNLGKILNRLSEEKIYGSEMSREEYIGLCKSIRGNIDFYTITVEEAKRLGFEKWDEETNLWLFPLWLYYIIPDGMKIIYIDGTEGEFKANVTDNDTRFGCLCYGIKIEN